MIIFFNGSSSSGKTTIAKAIQHLSSDKKYLVLGIDTFIKMMPVGLLGFNEAAKDGFYLEQHGELLEPRVSITPGPFAKKITSMAPQVCKLMADLGFDLIIDEVVLSEKNMQEYVLALSEHLVYFVKIYCDLNVLQEREILRGNRSWGMAREQFLTLHKSTFNYDLEINNSSGSIFEKAEKILDFIKNNQQPQGFRSMLKNVGA